MRKTIFAALLVIALFANVSLVFAEGPTELTVEVREVASGNLPIERAAVTLYIKSGVTEKIVSQGLTGEKGVVTLGWQAYGTYRIAVGGASGYKVASKESSYTGQKVEIYLYTASPLETVAAVLVIALFIVLVLCAGAVQGVKTIRPVGST